MDQSKIVILVGSFSVLPACAGVIPMYGLSATPKLSITRMRGGDPEKAHIIGSRIKYYPHARG